MDYDGLTNYDHWRICKLFEKRYRENDNFARTFLYFTDKEFLGGV